MSNNVVEISGASSSRYLGELGSFFASLLPYQDIFQLPNILVQPEEGVLNRLIPSYKYKLGKGFTESAKAKSRELVKESIDCGQAIPLVANIGTSKWFDGSNTERNIAGLSELLMLEQMSLVDRRVRSVFQNGVRWTLLAEDVTNLWLYSHINTPEAIALNNQTYLDSLELVVQKARENLSLEVRLVRESSLNSLCGKGIREYLDLLNTNQSLFMEFFEATLPYESQLLMVDEDAKLSQKDWEVYISNTLPTFTAYKMLQERGWSGGVHPSQRRYYENQFEKSGGEEAKALSYISAYFGSVLARRQMQFAREASGGQAIKVAFLRYPEGTSEKEMSALTISQHPLYGHGSSHKRISPWAAITNTEVSEKGMISLRVRLARGKEIPVLDQFDLSYAGMTVPVNLLEASSD